MEFQLRSISQCTQWVPELILWLFPQFQNASLEKIYLAAGRNPPFLFPDLWSEGYYGEKGQAEAKRTASTQETFSQKQDHIPGGI